MRLGARGGQAPRRMEGLAGPPLSVPGLRRAPMPWALMDGCSTPMLSHHPGWSTLWGRETLSTPPSSSACPRVSTSAGGTGLGPRPCPEDKADPATVPPSREEHAGGTEVWLPSGWQEVWPAGLRWHCVSARWQEAHITSLPRSVQPDIWTALLLGRCRPWEGSAWHPILQSCRANKSPSPEPASFWQSVCP